MCSAFMARKPQRLCAPARWRSYPLRLPSYALQTARLKLSFHSKTYPKTLSKITLPKALLDVITNLSRFRSIDVIARGSSFAFRDREISIKEIGQQLQSAIRDRRERAADWLACSRAITEAAQSRLTRLAGSRDDLIPAHYVPRDEPFHDAEQQIKQRKSFGDGLDMKSLTSEEDLDTSSGAYSGPVCRT
jgi:hypothetical protein